MRMNGLPDTPWHVGFVKKDKDDPRRHKSRCIHIKNGICLSRICDYFNTKCGGSAHCMYYAESESHWEEVKLNIRTIEEEMKEPSLIIKQLNEGKSSGKIKRASDIKVERIDETKPHVFLGDEAIEMKDIVESEEYKKWKPDDSEIKRIYQYYTEHRKMDEPVLLELSGNKYILRGNFSQYYLTKKLGKTRVRARLKR